MMIVALNEHSEPRVAITPTTVGLLQKLGFKVNIEHNAGFSATYVDELYKQAGAIISKDRHKILQSANVLVSINPPDIDLINLLPEKSLIISQIKDDESSELIKRCCEHKISVLSLQSIPHLRRTQTIDISSQEWLTGYRAVVEAAYHYHRTVPMMITSSGELTAAKVIVLGTTITAIQAVLTAIRQGAQVIVFDFHDKNREHVESTGADFFEITEEILATHLSTANIIICNLKDNNSDSPILITKELMKKMHPGSVIVDLFTTDNGNCELSKQNKTIKFNGITVIASSNMACLVPGSSSELYSRNVVNLLRLIVVASSIVFNAKDEVIKKALLCHNGNYKPFK